MLLQKKMNVVKQRYDGVSNTNVKRKRPGPWCTWTNETESAGQMFWKTSGLSSESSTLVLTVIGSSVLLAGGHGSLTRDWGRPAIRQRSSHRVCDLPGDGPVHAVELRTTCMNHTAMRWRKHWLQTDHSFLTNIPPLFPIKGLLHTKI